MSILRPPKFPLRNMTEWSKWLQEQQIEAGLGSPDVDGRVLASTAAGVRSWERRLDNWPAQFRATSNQALSTSAITIALDTTDYDPGVKYAVSGGVVLVEAAGYYKINYTVFVAVATGGATGDLVTWLTKEDESTVIPGSYTASYLEEAAANPDAACSGCCLVLLDAGEGFAVRAQESSTINATTDGDRCSVVIERVR